MKTREVVIDLALPTSGVAFPPYYDQSSCLVEIQLENVQHIASAHVGWCFSLSCDDASSAVGIEAERL